MIKKRSAADEPALAKAIEEFGAEANSSTPPPPARATSPAAPKDDLPKSMVVRFDGAEELAQAISNVAGKEDRSKHWVAIQALRRGLREMGESV